MSQDAKRKKPGKEMVRASVVWDAALLAALDARAKELDMNRSQYVRRLAKAALAQPLKEAA